MFKGLKLLYKALGQVFRALEHKFKGSEHKLPRIENKNVSREKYFFLPSLFFGEGFIIADVAEYVFYDFLKIFFHFLWWFGKNVYLYGNDSVANDYRFVDCGG